MTGIMDTHAHIVCDTLYPQVEDILIRAKQAGIDRILCICLCTEEVRRAFALKERYDWIDIAAGYHPSDLNDITLNDWEEMEELLKDERILAVGEIGLDYHWDDVDKEVQKKAFIHQIQTANALHKPILIHMRDATKDTMEILKEYKQVPGILHCYSGSLETAKEAIAMDMYISVGGPLTFKNARGIPEVMEQLPIERILIETDCPYLTPHPHRGKQNEPSYITYTLQALCRIKNMDETAMKQQLYENYVRLFTR